jgi:hypothetical protein
MYKYTSELRADELGISVEGESKQEGAFSIQILFWSTKLF